MPEVNNADDRHPPRGRSDDTLRTEAESRARRDDQAVNISGTDVRLLIHDLGVHQAELEIQNEELRRTQLELETSRSRYLDLYEEAPIGYLTLTANDLIHEINREGAQMLGVQRRPLINRRLQDFIWEGHRARVADARRALFDTGHAQQVETQVRSASGRWFWVRLHMNLVTEAESGDQWARVAFIDSTDARRVQEFTAHLAAIVASSADAIISTDREGIITSWNEGAHTLYGYEARRAIGQSIDMLVGPSMRRPSRHVRSPVVVNEQTEHRCQDGGIVAVSLTASPIIAEEGRPLGTSFISRNITQQRADERRMKQLLFEVRQQAQALRDADERKNEFIAVLAHELRNPLAPIRNAVSVMRLTEIDDPRIVWSRDVIDRQVVQMSALLEDLMDVRRVTQGKITLHLDRVDIALAIQRAVETVQPVMDANRHSLTIETPVSLLEVKGDLARMTQIIGNILSNAAKYTERGGRIVLSVCAVGSYVRVLVADNGVGLAREDLVSVFDAFSQVESSLERSQGGLGIGLSLVRALVELHGGTVLVSSEGRGHGSTFAVYLPLMSHADAVAVIDRPSPGTHSPGVAARVLVVDDNLDAGDSIGEVMRMLGHQVSIARDGESAIELAERMHPDVILLDLGLPDMDGSEVALRLRETGWGRDALVIACTGRSDLDGSKPIPPNTIQYHAVKPYDVDRLRHLIRDHMVARSRSP